MIAIAGGRRGVWTPPLFDLPLFLLATSSNIADWLPGGTLADHVHAGDSIYFSSGDPTVSNAKAALIKAAYPGMLFYCVCQGLANATTLAAGVSADVDAIGNYWEPTYTDFPDTEWNAADIAGVKAKTVTHMTNLHTVVHAAGKRSFAMPTGQVIRPLSKSNPIYFDMYTQIGAYVDDVFPQCQQHVQAGTAGIGMIHLNSEFGGDLSRVFPQATIDSTAPNGAASAREGFRNASELQTGGAGKCVLWWASATQSEADDFLTMRDAAMGIA